MAEKIIYDVQVKTGKASANVKKLDKDVKTVGKSAGKTGGGLTKGFAGLGNSIGAAIPMLGRLKAALISTGVGAIAVAIGALAGLFGTAASKGAKFEKSLSTLKAVSGATEGELGALSVQAKQLGSTTQFTAVEVVKLQTELAKLGFEAKDIQTSTPAILSLASSLEVDLASAAELAGSTVRAFGLTTKDTAKVVDVMALSTSSSALNFEALKESLKLVAPTSRATGVSIEKTAALLGVLANNGLKGSVAGTGLSKTFIELNKKGLTLEEGMAKVAGSSNKLNTAIELVGVVGAKSFLSLAESGEQINELEDTFNNAAGAADRMAEIRLDNLSGDITKLGSAWEGLLLSIEDGNGLLARFTRGLIQTSTAVLGFFTSTEKVSDSMNTTSIEFGVATSNLYKYDRQLNDTNLSEEARNKAGKKREELFKSMQKDYPKLLGNLNLEKDGFLNVSKAVADVNKQLINKVILQRGEEEITQKINDQADKLEKKKAIEKDREFTLVKLRRKWGLSADKTEADVRKKIRSYNKDNFWNSTDAGDLDRFRDQIGRINAEMGKGTRDLNVLHDARNKMEEEFGITLSENAATINDIDTTVTDTEDTTDTSDADKLAAAALLIKELEIIRKGGVVGEDAERAEKLHQIEVDYTKRIALAKKHHGELSEEVEMLEAAQQLKTELQQKVFDDQDEKRRLAKIEKKRIEDEKEQQKLYDKNTQLLESSNNDFALKRELLAEQRQLILEDETISAQERIRMLQENSDASVTISQKEADAKRAVLGGVGAALSAFSDLAGRETAKGKALATAAALINTYKGISEIWGAKAEGTASTTLASKILASAVVGIQGFKAVKSINAVKVPGSSGGSGAIAPASPTFNVVGQSPSTVGSNAAAADSQIENNNSNPQRAYVVSTDITNQQSLDRDIEDSNTLG